MGGGALRHSWCKLPGYLPPVSDPYDLDHRDPIVHRVDDTIRPLSQAVAVSMTGELLTANWSRVVSQRPNTSNDSLTIRPPGHTLKLPDRRRFDEQPISCHAVSVF